MPLMPSVNCYPAILDSVFRVKTFALARYLVVGSYLALYKVDEDSVRVVRALHAHRDLGGLFVE